MPLHRVSGACASACLFLASFLGLSSARADSYSFVDLATSSGSISTAGITANGTVEMQSGLLGYQVYSQASGWSSWSQTKPSLTFDNGSSCSVANTGVFDSIADVTCNNGHLAFFGMTATSRGLYSGFDLVNDLIYNRNAGQIRLNANGDVAFIAYEPYGTGDVNMVAYDLSSNVTPEPSSLMLFGTGALLAVGAIRRKLPA